MNILNDANKGIETYTATLDVSKAYNRTKLWNKLAIAILNAPKYLIELIKSTYENHTETYKIGGETTKPDPLTQGLNKTRLGSPCYISCIIHPLHMFLCITPALYAFF